MAQGKNKPSTNSSDESHVKKFWTQHSISPNQSRAVADNTAVRRPQMTTAEQDIARQDSTFAEMRGHMKSQYAHADSSSMSDLPLKERAKHFVRAMGEEDQVQKSFMDAVSMAHGILDKIKNPPPKQAPPSDLLKKKNQ